MRGQESRVPGWAAYIAHFSTVDQVTLPRFAKMVGRARPCGDQFGKERICWVSDSSLQNHFSGRAVNTKRLSIAELLSAVRLPKAS